MVYRVYVEKKTGCAAEASALQDELASLPGVTGLSSVRILNRYDVEGISNELFRQAVDTVFSEPPVDTVLDAPPKADRVLAVEYLPGQFDQRADSAAEAIQLISQGVRPLVQSARVYLFYGEVTDSQWQAIRRHLINPVEARETGLEEKATLETAYPVPPDVTVLDGFNTLTGEQMPAFIAEYALAMDTDDLAFCQAYFRQEGRSPTLTELRVIDTYWSDHCRHTTFGTVLQHLAITDENTLKTYNRYLSLRKQLYENTLNKPQTLMDIATIGAKAIRQQGGLAQLDQSDEINACSVNIKAMVNGKEEDWLLLYKNETHNHPTEIEPFGGAATCIGGAIRDPLANRGYVFGSMRITGAGNPLVPVADTLPGKLPQRRICTTAAAGFSSYGNQIGLAAGQVHELYHPGYVAKRMELGAVLGAVPTHAVRRETPEPGDVVLLIGGRTGRDGCGGATGSSMAHDTASLESCGAQVQKGNAPVERKLQRLFKNPNATRLIRRCNDFGAGGVAVAIGELADGLCVQLDAVPKKYDGLDGTELAISESQERMAVVVAEKDAKTFIAMAGDENLEATRVAVITSRPRLVMEWRGNTIVNLSRDFLNSNGAEKSADVQVDALPLPIVAVPSGNTLQEKLHTLVTGLNHCSQKGLVSRFDSTIGAGSLLVPFGGKHQLSPAQAMAMKLPVNGETTTCAGMAFGYDPSISEQNPYTGAYLAVVDSVTKLAAAGFSLRDMTLSFQEYFPRLGGSPTRWGQPFAALMGALQAQLDLGVAAIGGKDSMSGSFEDLDVPPTLVSFAVAPGQAARVLPQEFQLPLSRVVWLRPSGGGMVPSAAGLKMVLAQLDKLLRERTILSIRACGAGGLAKALFEMCLGNRIGITLDDTITSEQLFAPAFGSFIVELADNCNLGTALGETTAHYHFAACGEKASLEELQQAYTAVLEPVYPCQPKQTPAAGLSLSIPFYTVDEEKRKGPKIGIAKPRAVIPVFPGTNCEIDTARALQKAGADADIFVVRNLTPDDVAESAALLAKKIDESQMVILPGGFSGGDEPEGSAKLICAFFRGQAVANAVTRLLEQRDGLMLGICNGFQALIKLGLVPFGRILPLTENSPTLTFNTIGRHQSTLVRTRVVSNLSPWLCRETTGAIHTLAVSHGEGRLLAENALLDKLAAAGQIATQYVDITGEPSMDIAHNPCGSLLAVEGITSPDGRVYGKMAHTERCADDLFINVPGNKNQRLFESGTAYFSL